MGEQAKASGINLQGLAIGDGLCDPRNMGGYGPFLFQVGLIDEPQRDHFIETEKRAIELIDAGQYYKAFQVWDELLNGDLTTKGTSYFKNATGLNFYYNFLLDSEPEDFAYYNAYLGLKETREVQIVFVWTLFLLTFFCRQFTLEVVRTMMELP